MGHRPFPDPDRALRHIRRRHPASEVSEADVRQMLLDTSRRITEQAYRRCADEPPLADDYEPPDVRLAAASVTGPPVPGLPLPDSAATNRDERQS